MLNGSKSIKVIYTYRLANRYSLLRYVNYTSVKFSKNKTKRKTLPRCFFGQLAVHPNGGPQVWRKSMSSVWDTLRCQKLLAGLELVILLPHPLRLIDYRRAPPRPAKLLDTRASRRRTIQAGAILLQLKCTYQIL
jgi:hypothetical protein